MYRFFSFFMIRVVRSMSPSCSNITILRNEINLYSYSWNKSEQSITMNHKYTDCGLDVNKLSLGPLHMILVL